MNCPNCHAENDDASDSCFDCGKSLFSLTKGSLLGGRYLILSQLGRGGMGMVYKAQDQDLEETVAIKVLRSDIAASSDIARRFRDEIRLARRVRHKNVCGIHEYGQDGHLRFIVMELVDGIDLRRVLRQAGRGLAWDEAYDVAIQVAHGLQAVHEVGIVHRDLKTPNIMRDQAGHVRLMDFGIAKSFEAGAATGATATGQIVGTPEYMSPEQVRAEKLDARSDIYSLGIVTYELFTGDVPFRADTPLRTLFLHLQEPPPLDPGCGLPAPLIPVVARALAKDRDQRFASAALMAGALEAARATASRVSVPLPAAAAVGFEEDLVFEGTESMSTPVPTPVPTARPLPPRAVTASEFPTTPVPARRATPRAAPALRPAPVHSAGSPRSTGTLAVLIVSGFVLLGSLILWGAFRVLRQRDAPASPALVAASPIVTAPPPEPVAASIAATVPPSLTPAPVPAAAIAVRRAPVARSPRSGARVALAEAAAGIHFEWDAVAGAASYRVMVTDGRRVLADQSLARTAWEGPGLPAGSYQWRVNALDAAGQPGPESGAIAFAVVAPVATALPILPLREPPRAGASPTPTAPPETTLPAVVPTTVNAAPGALQIVVLPWAEVVVDGVERGTTPFRQPLTAAPGTHLVRLTHPGYEPIERVATVEPGQTVTLRVDLTKEGVPKRRQK